jgi:2-dehydro-3-deoxyphosphogluconate aldolase/(4S)-4-hydroxy-2-oxoglutarate aldolase
MPDTRPSPSSLLDDVASLGVVPVVVIDERREARHLVEALSGGGLPCAEVTLRTPAAMGALEDMSAGEGFIAGAGTVLHAAQAKAAIHAGARFLVSPGLSREVVEVGREAGVPVLPGVATATEAMAALDLAVDVVKFFPARTLGGPAALRALAAPFASELRFMPTGGIDADTLPDYLAIPEVIAVGGTWIASRELLNASAFDEITHRARDAVHAVTTARSPSHPSEVDEAS